MAGASIEPGRVTPKATATREISVVQIGQEASPEPAASRAAVERLQAGNGRFVAAIASDGLRRP